jgi:hypothetical protein
VRLQQFLIQGVIRSKGNAVPGFAGLQTNLITWLIMAAVTACWLMSVRLIRMWAREGWPALLKSLFGMVWLGFGLDIVLRFVMLSYNAVEWGNNTARLVTLPVETVNSSLTYCGLFWVLMSLGYAIAVRRSTAGPLAWTTVLTPELAYAAAVPTGVLCSVLFCVTDAPGVVPLALLTPLALVAMLYIVPATIIWWDHFRRPGPAWRIGGVHVIALLPALIHGWRSPYRENLAPLFLIPLLGALFAGRRPKLRKLIPAGVIVFLILSALVTSYRRIKWENVRPEEVSNEIQGDGLVNWLAGDFGERMSRFHSFDSILLTVHIVPSAKPYSRRSVLVMPFVRGFVPRFLYETKGIADAGEKFGGSIWAYENPFMREHSGAAIAPSMPGDLYESGGLLDVALGALLWGAVVGLVDGWKGRLPVFCAAAITALLATHCAMSIERDFDHEVAGLIQTLLLFVVVIGMIALARRRTTDFARDAHPSLGPSWPSAIFPLIKESHLQFSERKGVVGAESRGL